MNLPHMKIKGPTVTKCYSITAGTLEGTVITVHINPFPSSLPLVLLRLQTLEALLYGLVG